MKTPDKGLLETATQRLVAEFQPEQIWLFGSHAWGTPDADSDIDLFVIVSQSGDGRRGGSRRDRGGGGRDRGARLPARVRRGGLPLPPTCPLPAAPVLGAAPGLARLANAPRRRHLPGMRLPDRIQIRPEVMRGKPCIKGTRIPVYLLLQKMAAGEAAEAILAAYPQLKPDDLTACLDYASQLAAEEAVLTGA